MVTKSLWVMAPRYQPLMVMCFEWWVSNMVSVCVYMLNLFYIYMYICNGTNLREPTQSEFTDWKPHLWEMNFLMCLNRLLHRTVSSHCKKASFRGCEPQWVNMGNTKPLSVGRGQSSPAERKGTSIAHTSAVLFVLHHGLFSTFSSPCLSLVFVAKPERLGKQEGKIPGMS